MKKLFLTSALSFILTQGFIGQHSIGYIKIYGHDKKTEYIIIKLNSTKLVLKKK